MSSIETPSFKAESLQQKCIHLLEAHKNNPFVTREELEQLLGFEVDVEEFLDELIKTGKYIMHGSQYKIEELEPRQAKDNNKVPENMHKAIYATDMPEIALYMSLVSDKKIKEHELSLTYGAGVTQTGGKRIPRFNSSEPFEMIAAGGYIYVLDRSKFVQTTPDPMDEQFISKEIQHPVLVIPTAPGDFKYPVEQSRTISKPLE